MQPWYSNVTKIDPVVLTEPVPGRSCPLVSGRGSISRNILLCLLLLSSFSLLAQNAVLNTQKSLTTVNNNQVVPADSAFKLQAFVEADESVVLVWDILPNHYLYRQSLGISDSDGNDIQAELPAGSRLSDEFFGEVEVYFDRLLIRIPLKSLAKTGKQVHLQLAYQGCAKDLYCYPPQLRTIELDLP